jgi:hypothetical protein
VFGKRSEKRMPKLAIDCKGDGCTADKKPSPKGVIICKKTALSIILSLAHMETIAPG